MDLFVGYNDGTMGYFLNNGSASNPSFVQQTGVQNPLNGEDVGVAAIPEFVDIDNDGDMDLFVGDNDGFVHFFENDSLTSSTRLSFQEHQIQLFPSPNNGTFNLSFSLEQAVEDVLQVYNLQGQQAYQQALNLPAGNHQLTIDLPELPQGGYFLRIANQSMRFVKK